MPEPGNIQVVGESRGVKSGEFGGEGNIVGRVWASEFLRVGDDWNGSGRGVGAWLDDGQWSCEHWCVTEGWVVFGTCVVCCVDTERQRITLSADWAHHDEWE